MKVAVLRGGRSLEREVSLQSGKQVELALRQLGHDVHPIEADKGLFSALAKLKPDLCFITLHGEDGEDGTVQEMLDLLGLAYTGSGPASCRICWDKISSKQLAKQAGINTPDWVSVSGSALKDLGAAAALKGIGQRFGFPIVVKPVKQGSALGLNVVEDETNLPAALLAALSYDDRALIERFVPGRDLAVAVIDGEVLPAIEVSAFDEDRYSARYTIGATDMTCPADLSVSEAQKVSEAALEAYTVLGCQGFARVDLLLDDSGNVHLLEVDAVPGLTHSSYLPVAAEAAGINFEQLVDRIIKAAV